MKNGMNPMETDADVKRARVTAFSDEQVDDPVHTTLSENGRANYGDDAEIMMIIAKSKIEGVLAEEAGKTYAKAVKRTLKQT